MAIVYCYNTLGFKAAELEDMKDSFHEDTTSQIGLSGFLLWINLSEHENVSFFSSPCGLSGGVAYAVNLMTENLTFSSLQAKTWTKNKIHSPPEIVLASVFACS